MTKEQFLQDFDDINFMYNNAMMKDSLERHIDELLETELEKIKAEIKKVIDKHISELKGNEDFNHEEFYNFLLNTIQPNEMEKYRNMFLSSGEIVN